MYSKRDEDRLMDIEMNSMGTANYPQEAFVLVCMAREMRRRWMKVYIVHYIHILVASVVDEENMIFEVSKNALDYHSYRTM
ncbi:hypothetical protein X777_12068 [Ooceraea biroi]|uniref:Uncharacterized protein n=1 Tax=Ooceraea biroi TaxID=2015173 RepID=A0A026X022_OOCBI|nr:hypothetical protein X777_12068 [Ooceraea biroi]